MGGGGGGSGAVVCGRERGGRVEGVWGEVRGRSLSTENEGGVGGYKTVGGGKIYPYKKEGRKTFRHAEGGGGGAEKVLQ